jgi:hypothetical protein
MKTYKITLKHDRGRQVIWVTRETEREAINALVSSELAPESAIIRIELQPWYVTMTDKFMSGWGMAEGKTNKLIIVCETYEEAQTIERNACKRSEMRYVNITRNKPRYGRNVLESWKKYTDMGAIWKQ